MCRPLVILASALSAGSILGSLNPIKLSSSISIALAAIFCAALARILYRRRPNAALAMLLCAAFAAGVARAGDTATREQSISAPVGEKAPMLCEGSVMGEPQERQWGTVFDLALSSCSGRDGSAMQRATGAARVTARVGAEGLAPGVRVRLMLRLSKPREFKNEGSFSYRRYLMVQGIAATGFAAGKVEILGGSRASFVSRALRSARIRVARSIDRAIVPPARAIVAAMAVGSRDDFTPDLQEAFSQAGLSHLIAISGLNVGYVALFIYLLARATLGLFPWLLVRVPLPRIAALVTMPAAWAYVFFTGGAISAIRAALMLTVYLAGVIFSWRQDLITTIAASAIIIIAYSPLSVLDVSFQLSILAVLGMALMVPQLQRFLGAENKREGFARKALAWMAAMFAVSLAATLSTAPLIAYHFKFVSAVGLIANTVGVPLTGLMLQPVIMAATAVAIYSPDAAAMLWAMSGWSADLLIWLARTAADYGAPMVGRFAPTPAEALLAYAALAAIIFWKRLPGKRAVAAMLAMLFSFDAAYWQVAPRFDRNLSVTFFDVGQGDAALVRFPGGRTLLIDGGGLRGSEFDVGKNVLAPALWRMGVHHIDWVVLTHPHQDHYGGLGYIAERFSPALIWTNGLSAPVDEKEQWDTFVSRLAEAHVPMVFVEEGSTEFNVEGSSLRILRQRVPEKDVNDTSLAVIASVGDHRFIFMGDLSSRGEASLLADQGDLTADVLKVGHHGSRDASSSAFLDAVRPAIAVIPAGEQNRYGFPHRETLARLGAVGARIYRTGRDGTVTVKSDGEKLKVSTYMQ
ncbi:MAG: DNA internalization-related competence protein ComEC/Rec2 [bacterium]